jgi:hypothetical protein
MSDLLGRERELLTGLDPAQSEELAGLLRVLLAPFDAADGADTVPPGGEAVQPSGHVE